MFEGIDPKPPTSHHRKCSAFYVVNDMPSKVLIFLVLVFLLSACHSKHKALETINLSQRQEQQLHCYDTFWQHLTFRFEDLVVEWLVDSLPADHGQSTTIRLRAQCAEVSREQQSAMTVVAIAQRTDTMIQQREEMSSVGVAVPELVEGPHSRRRLWLLSLWVLFLGAGFFVLKKRFGWPR